VSGSRALGVWLAIAAAPLAWFGQLALGYEAVEGGCASAGGSGDVFGIDVESAALSVTAVAVVLACVGVISGVVTWRGHGGAEYSHFLAFIGLLGSMVLMMAIVLSGIAIVALDPCGQS